MKLVEREIEILNETNNVQVTRACDNVESKKIRDVEANGKFEILDYCCVIKLGLMIFSSCLWIMFRDKVMGSKTNSVES